MKTAASPRAWALLLPLLLVLGCDAPSALLSQEELKSIYGVDLASKGLPLKDGSAAVPGASIEVALDLLGRAELPVALGITLESAEGGSVASLRYATSAAKGAAAGQDGLVLVKALGGELPSFTLPEELPPGLYALAWSLEAADGSRLQEGRTLLLSAPPAFGPDSASIYPPDPVAGSPVLLSLGLSAGLPALAPEDILVRWSFEGRVFAVGSLADGYDRRVWRGPREAGAYRVLAELFPTSDAEAVAGIASPWNREFRCIVKAAEGAAFDPLADTSRFVSLLEFEGEVVDSAPAERPEPPRVTGKPRLADYPGGFGLRLGPDSDVLLRELGIPAAYSIVARLHSGASVGSIAVLSDPTTGRALSLSLDKGAIVVVLSGPEGERRFASPARFGPGLLDLMLSVLPGAGGVEFALTAGGERFRSGFLAGAEPPRSGNLGVGGPGSLPATWDLLAVSDDRLAGPPPFLEAQLRAIHGSSLLGAWGFEGRSLPPEVRSTGSASLAGLRARLAPAATLSLGAGIDAPAFMVDLDYQAEPSALRLDLLDGEGRVVASADGAGVLYLADGSSAGPRVPARRGGRLSLEVRRDSVGLTLALPGSAPFLVAAPLAEGATLSLALRSVEDSGGVGVERLAAWRLPDGPLPGSMP